MCRIGTNHTRCSIPSAPWDNQRPPSHGVIRNAIVARHEFRPVPGEVDSSTKKLELHKVERYSLMAFFGAEGEK